MGKLFCCSEDTFITSSVPGMNAANMSSTPHEVAVIKVNFFLFVAALESPDQQISTSIP